MEPHRFKSSLREAERPDSLPAPHPLSCLCVIGVLLLASTGSRAETLPCTIDGSPPASEITLTVPADGNIPLYIICNGASALPATFSLALTEFSGDVGPVQVDLLLPPDYKLARGKAPLTIPAALVLPLRLSVRSPPPSGKYSGRLIIAAANRDPLVGKIALIRGISNAALIVAPASVILPVTKPFFGWKHDDEPVVAVTLRGRSDQSGIEGITVRLEQLTKQPDGGFSLSRNATFSFNGQPVSDFEVWPSKQGEPERSLPIGGQAAVGIVLKNLKPGEYITGLRFQGLNLGSDDVSKLALTVQVRHSIWWAVIFLLIAVLFSFVVTRFVTSLRHRYVFLQRLRDLRPPWLSQEPPVVAVVRVRAILKQSEDLSRRFWMTGATLIDARVNQVAATLAILDKVRRLREQVTRPDVLPRLPRIRAVAALDQIVSRLDEGPPNEAAINDLNAELTAFVTWLTPGMVTDRYWADVSAAIVAFRRDFNLAAIEDTTGRAAMGKLDVLLREALLTKPADLDAMMNIERSYAALKILWERHGTDEFQQLVDIVKPEATADRSEAAGPEVREINEYLLQRIFELADRSAWNRLRAAAAKKAVKIVVPCAGDSGSAEAYDPLRFDIETADSALSRTYLFAHGLEFQWTFSLNYSKRRASPGVMAWTPRSAEGRVVQYAPRGGALSTSVRIQKYGETVDVPAAELAIAGSSDFGTFRGLAKVEVISWVLAAGVAIVTGLSMFYLKSPTFGSFQDYLALFLWGAGVDQGKNFVQTLQAYSSTP
jgi:hypothetical protein